MPDFETRRPPGTKRPSRAQMFEVAFREAVYALGDRLHISKRSVDILLLVLLAVNLTVIAIFWALNNEIQLETPPAYNDVTEEFATNNDGDTSYSCFSKVVDGCYKVFTEPTSAVKLASITKAVLADSHSEAVSVEFNTENTDGTPGDSIGTSYCFDSTVEEVSTLHLHLGKAELLGSIDYCNIAVYKRHGDGSNLAALP
jgi:hypothetical protein